MKFLFNFTVKLYKNLYQYIEKKNFLSYSTIGGTPLNVSVNENSTQSPEPPEKQAEQDFSAITTFNQDDFAEMDIIMIAEGEQIEEQICQSQIIDMKNASASNEELSSDPSFNSDFLGKIKCTN